MRFVIVLVCMLLIKKNIGYMDKLQTATGYEEISLSSLSSGDYTCLKDLIVSLTIKNTGHRTGTEIVQLYLADPHAQMTRPVRELQGFARVGLAPGEEKRIGFLISPSQMAFLDEDMRWMIEKGTIDVLAGASSEDIRLHGAFQISRTCWIEGRDRRFCAETLFED